MTEQKMYWLNEKDSFEDLRDDMYESKLKGLRFGRKSSPHRLYIVTSESAEVVIEELRYYGYTVREITNYD